MAGKQLDRLPSFEDLPEDDGTPAVVPVEPREVSESLIAEAGTQAGTEEAPEGAARGTAGASTEGASEGTAGASTEVAGEGTARASTESAAEGIVVELIEVATLTAFAPPRRGEGWEESLVNKVQKRSKGPHDPYMKMQRMFIKYQEAAQQLFDEEENNGMTQSFKDSRIGLNALRSAVRTLNGYLADMEQYYRENPEEPNWFHHTPPARPNGGWNKSEGWEHHGNNLHYWNSAGSFCEPQQRMLMVPTVHMTPDGPRNGFVSVTYQEKYDRTGKRARKEPWEVGGEEDTTMESTAQGSDARSSYEGYLVPIAEEVAAAGAGSLAPISEEVATETIVAEEGAAAEGAPAVGTEAPHSEAAAEAVTP